MSNDQLLRRFVLGLGEDEQGELYVLTTRTPGSLFETGELWQITLEGE
jgi:hypothetical protein